jgi:hypothetical protein
MDAYAQPSGSPIGFTRADLMEFLAELLCSIGFLHTFFTLSSQAGRGPLLAAGEGDGRLGLS